MDKCSWKKCRQWGDYIAVADRKEGTYHLCQSCWERVAKIENGISIQENLTRVAIPKKHNGDNNE
tara:strand:+ start:134 stop:328 length:195 start_codon:yes stop_codon:yes gene_type:complete